MLRATHCVYELSFDGPHVLPTVSTGVVRCSGQNRVADHPDAFALRHLAHALGPKVASARQDYRGVAFFRATAQGNLPRIDDQDIRSFHIG